MQIGDVPQSRKTVIVQWQDYISAGNRYLIGSELHAAKFQYEMARQCAEKMFRIKSDLYQSGPALVVTYHNIADLNRKLGNVSLVKFYLQKAHEAILKELMETGFNDERHSLLLKLSLKTYSKLIRFKKCTIYN